VGYLYGLAINGQGSIRTYQRTNGATGAAFSYKMYGVISLYRQALHIKRQNPLGTSCDTQSAAFAIQLIDLDRSLGGHFISFEDSLTPISLCDDYIQFTSDKRHYTLVLKS
jgi:hypothetical protein